MKKTAIVCLAVFALSLAPVYALTEDNPDLQAVKKAVKKNPNIKRGDEAKWFKVLITDTDTGKDKVKITMPLSLVEIFMRATGDRNLRVDLDDCDLDLKEVFLELKKLGPMALIEICQDDELIKIWLE